MLFATLLFLRHLLLFGTFVHKESRAVNAACARVREAVDPIVAHVLGNVDRSALLDADLNLLTQFLSAAHPREEPASAETCRLLWHLFGRLDPRPEDSEITTIDLPVPDYVQQMLSVASMGEAALQGLLSLAGDPALEAAARAAARGLEWAAEGIERGDPSPMFQPDNAVVGPGGQVSRSTVFIMLGLCFTAALGRCGSNDALVDAVFDAGLPAALIRVGVALQLRGVRWLRFNTYFRLFEHSVLALARAPAFAVRDAVRAGITELYLVVSSSWDYMDLRAGTSLARQSPARMTEQMA